MQEDIEKVFAQWSQDSSYELDVNLSFESTSKESIQTVRTQQSQSTTVTNTEYESSVIYSLTTKKG